MPHLLSHCLEIDVSKSVLWSLKYLEISRWPKFNFKLEWHWIDFS